MGWEIVITFVLLVTKKKKTHTHGSPPEGLLLNNLQTKLHIA